MFYKVKSILIPIYISKMIIVFNLIFRKLNFNFFIINSEKLLQYILFKFFKSNHKNRLDHVNNLHIQKKLFSSLDRNRNFERLCFIGDSHVEVYSRSNIYNFFYLYPKAIWLGPCTILGTYFTQKHNEYIKKISFYLDFGFKRRCNHLVFSIGSIDIRTLFYQLLIAKSVENEDELFNKFEEGIKYFIDEIVLKIKNNKNVSFIKLYNSSILGDLPLNIKEINKIKINNEYPTFGNILKRYEWTKKANNILSKLCNNYKFNFIDIDIGEGEDSIKNYSDDGIHINDIDIINKITKKILNSA